MSPTPNPKTRRPKAKTRTAILAHAHEMYLDGRLRPGDERLAAVLAELGYTTGAGYQIWANQAAFQVDLSSYIAENVDYASLRAAASSIVDRIPDGLSFEQHMLAAGDQYISRFLETDAFQLQARFVAMSDVRPDPITSVLRDAYEKTISEVGKLFAKALEAHSRQIQEPLVMADLTGAVTAALEGFALRHAVQSEQVSKPVPAHDGEHHIFSVTLLAIITNFTEKIPT